MSNTRLPKTHFLKKKVKMTSKELGILGFSNVRGSFQYNWNP
jgi:hypothetical protein